MELVTSNQSLGQFSSNKGYADLIAASKSYGGLQKFFQAGQTDEVEFCQAELRDLASNSRDKSIAMTAVGLAKLMEGQTEVAVSDGVG